MFLTLRSTVLPFALSIQTFALTTPISDNDRYNILPRSSPAPPTSPFHISITDTKGTDLSQNITILLHKSLLSSAHPIPKRTPPGPQTYFTPSCLPGWEVQDSFCSPQIDLQSYRVLCLKADNAPGHRFDVISGACKPDEFCFQKSTAALSPTRRLVHTAHCVPQAELSAAAIEPFLGILEPSASSDTGDQHPPGSVALGASDVGLPSTGVGDGQYTLEAVLAAPDLRTGMNATKMQVEAQRSVNGKGQVLPAGLVECTECSRLSMDPVPEGTHSVMMSLVLQAGVTAGTVLVGALIL